MAVSAVLKFCLERRHEYCVLSLEPVITDFAMLECFGAGDLVWSCDDRSRGGHATMLGMAHHTSVWE